MEGGGDQIGWINDCLKRSEEKKEELVTRKKGGGE